MHRKTVSLSSDVTLEYVERGNPAGLPVLFLHGYTDSWHSYELLLMHLPRAWRSIALSQRGHGDSSKPSSGYALDDFVADVAAFLDALAIDRAVIVGHSMGSMIAQRFASRHPERVVGLVLIGAFTSVRGNEAARAFFETEVAMLEDPIDSAFAVGFQQSTLHRPVPPTFFDTVVRESMKLPARIWRTVFEGLLAADLSTDRPRISVPTLLMWGDRDAFATRADQHELRRTIAGSRLIVYPDTGHDSHWEQPEQVGHDLIGFIDSVVTPAAAA